MTERKLQLLDAAQIREALISQRSLNVKKEEGTFSPPSSLL